MTDSLKRYRITFSADGMKPVAVLLGDTPITVASGYGGWNVVNRQRRVGLTVWQGKDPIRMSIPILFDGITEQASQEIPISHLSRMALPPGTGGEPPSLKIKGPGVPNPGPAKWVIENLQWGTNVIWDFAQNGVMARLRQDCVVNLLEYRAPDRAEFAPMLPASKRTLTGKSKAGWPKTYVIKDNDTLAKIAVHFYKDANKWKQIAQENGIRDPGSVSTKVWQGKTIRIPAP